MISLAPTRRRVLGAVIVVVVAGVVVGGLVWSRPARGPETTHVDRATEDTALAVIDARLRTGWGGLRVPASMPTEPGWVCTELVIESERRDADLRMALVASCEQYVRAPDALVSRAGYSAVPMVVTLAPDGDRLQIVAIQEAKDGAGYAPSVRQLFTGAGATAVLDGARPPSPSAIARKVFDLPDSVPVR